jgi:hypothetical protein
MSNASVFAFFDTLGRDLCVRVLHDGDSKSGIDVTDPDFDPSISAMHSRGGSTPRNRGGNCIGGWPEGRARFPKSNPVMGGDRQRIPARCARTARERCYAPRIPRAPAQATGSLRLERNRGAWWSPIPSSALFRSRQSHGEGVVFLR